MPISIDEVSSLAGKVSAMYICQSPAWVAPMNDQWYHYLVWDALALNRRRRMDYNQGYVERKMPSREEIEKDRKKYLEAIEKFREEQNDKNNN